MSGQKVNLQKSAFQTTKNVNTNLKDQIKQILQINCETKLDKYLGCPIINEKVTKETFSYIIQKSKSQLAKWKANTLSQEGRTVLIKSNLSAQPIYQMQSFYLPKNITEELDRINKNFF